ncbi:Bacteriophage protein gp37 [Variovorax sp. PBS-H4]|uniref:phage Gp37/Gp68 family protein n=1 Tax=Variovorax sp. PBS-H4 TaxID=434008 RepID=UPI0013173055|nr:phage Gp37/Gp68 family protein [Variovorax sp. PBS-H4]VTU38476.1 Bacteriophage protein gp37 [Variovorax sp. PBS-H4]
MSANSKIEWTDHTFNYWEGCQKTGPGCDNCYAETRNARFAGIKVNGINIAPNWGPGAPRRLTSESNRNLPAKWNREHAAFFAKHGRRQRVFCSSLSDVFDNQVPREWRWDLWQLIMATPNLDWLLLTKRIGNVNAMLKEPGAPINGLPSNVWLGATIVNQEEADRDIPKLLDVPASVRFLSMEPLLGPVSLRWLAAWPENAPTRAQKPGGITNHLDGLRRLDWVIVGGESGPKARPMHPDWALHLRDQCAEAGVPFLYKQWGEWKPISQMAEAEHTALYRSRVKAMPHESQDAIDDINGRACTVPYGVVHADGSLHEPLEPMAFLQGTGAMTTFKIGKKAAGRLLDGIEHNGYPR